MQNCVIHPSGLTISKEIWNLPFGVIILKIKQKIDFERYDHKKLNYLTALGLEEKTRETFLIPLEIQYFFFQEGCWHFVSCFYLALISIFQPISICTKAKGHCCRFYLPWLEEPCSRYIEKLFTGICAFYLLWFKGPCSKFNICWCVTMAVMYYF